MWTKERIHALLDKNPQAVWRAVLAIYERQTPSEQSAKTTTVHNNMGFSAFDARFLTEMAQKVRRGYHMTDRQLAVTRNKIKRYHRQLVEIANATEASNVQRMIDRAEMEEVIAMQAAEARESRAVAAYKHARDGQAFSHG